jgi:hypothetical protein
MHKFSEPVRVTLEIIDSSMRHLSAEERRIVWAELELWTKLDRMEAKDDKHDEPGGKVADEV